MTLESLAQLGEFVSGIAVLLTLLYLATQVRQAKEQIAFASLRHRADAAHDVLSSISDSPYLAPIFAKLGGFPWGNPGLESPEEQVRFFAWCHSWWRCEELIFKTTSPEQRATQEQLLMSQMAIPWQRAFWEGNKAIYDAGFAAHVDAILARVRSLEVDAGDLFANRSAAARASDGDDVEAAIHQLDACMVAALEARDLEAWLRCVNEDVCLLPPGALPIEGKPQVRAMLATVLAMPHFSVKHHPGTVSMSRGGDIAYLRYAYEMTTTAPDGSAVIERGKELSLFRRNPSGEWRLEVDMWSSDGPPRSLDATT